MIINANALIGVALASQSTPKAAPSSEFRVPYRAPEPTPAEKAARRKEDWCIRLIAFLLAAISFYFTWF